MLNNQKTTPLEERVREFLKREGHWADDVDAADAAALESVNISATSAAGQYFAHVPAPTTSGREYEIENIAWFIRHSDYQGSVEAARKLLGTTDWLPISSWEGDGGFFYDPVRDHVALITAGASLKAAIAGTLDPQWKSFNAFLEWYFELDADGGP